MTICKFISAAVRGAMAAAGSLATGVEVGRVVSSQATEEQAAMWPDACRLARASSLTPIEAFRLIADRGLDAAEAMVEAGEFGAERGGAS